MVYIKWKYFLSLLSFQLENKNLIAKIQHFFFYIRLTQWKFNCFSLFMMETDCERERFRLRIKNIKIDLSFKKKKKCQLCGICFDIDVLFVQSFSFSLSMFECLIC